MDTPASPIYVAVIAILHLCLYFGNSQTFLVPGLSLSKVYANTLLVLFTNRIKVSGGRSQFEGNTRSHIAEEESFSIQPEGDRNNTQGERPPPPSKNIITRKASLLSNASTVVVSNNRLMFRLGDMPPSPHSERPMTKQVVLSMDDTRC